MIDEMGYEDIGFDLGNVKEIENLIGLSNVGDVISLRVEDLLYAGCEVLQESVSVGFVFENGLLSNVSALGNPVNVYRKLIAFRREGIYSVVVGYFEIVDEGLLREFFRDSSSGRVDGISSDSFCSVHASGSSFGDLELDKVVSRFNSEEIVLYERELL